MVSFGEICGQITREELSNLIYPPPLVGDLQHTLIIIYFQNL